MAFQIKDIMEASILHTAFSNLHKHV